jgi:hypothetical protein
MLTVSPLFAIAYQTNGKLSINAIGREVKKGEPEWDRQIISFQHILGSIPEGLHIWHERVNRKLK